MMMPSDRDQRDAAAQQRGRRMKPVPLPVGEHRRPSGAGGVSTGSVTARPGGSRRARRAGRAAARRPRAAARGSTTFDAAAAVTSFRSASPTRARQRAARDVDELHPSVRHRDEALEHDAAAEQQVVVAQPVADRAHAARGEGDRHDRDDRRGRGQQQPERLPEDEPRDRQARRTSRCRRPGCRAGRRPRTWARPAATRRAPGRVAGGSWSSHRHRSR